MKKLLLATAALASALLTNAQMDYTIYDGENPSESFIEAFYPFEGSTASLDTISMDPVQSEISFTGSTEGYYVGGFGAAKFTGPDEKASISDYTGTVASTTVKFTASTGTTVLKVKFQFVTGGKTFGYEYELGEVAEYTEFSFPMSEVKEIIADNPTGDVITDAELLAIDEFQGVVVCTANEGVCDATLKVKNIIFSSLTVGVSDAKSSSITSFPNPTSNLVTFSQELSNVTVFDMKGNIVDSFTSAKTINVANYQAGLYYISSAEYNTKVVVK